MLAPKGFDMLYVHTASLSAVLILLTSSIVHHVYSLYTSRHAWSRARCELIANNEMFARPSLLLCTS